MTTTTQNRFALTLLSVVLALSLTACGDKSDKKVATQVAAKVGSEEISVHQINQIVSRSNTAGVSPAAAKAMSREVLEKLIDQQLAVDQAMENKLHRSPEVVSQIEAARREILARSYLQKIVSALPKPTPEEVRTYYAEHPQLFAQRRIFNVQEIVVPATPGVADQLHSFSLSGKSIESAAAWLKSKDIKFGGGNITRPAEQIPMELLAKIHPLKDGQSILIESPQSITLLRVASSQLSPVPEVAAMPRIEQFLGNQRANEAVTSKLKALRASAKITYMGEFENADAAPVAPAAAQATPVAEEDKTKTAIEKGMAGLK
jgi:EpsD family peptidyl-prolyl cis-trans isomerase